MTTRIARQNIGGRFVVFDMLNFRDFMATDFRIGSLYVVHQSDGIRITIPTMHSTTILTTDEARKLRDELTKLLRTRRTSTGV